MNLRGKPLLPTRNSSTAVISNLSPPPPPPSICSASHAELSVHPLLFFPLFSHPPHHPLTHAHTPAHQSHFHVGGGIVCCRIHLMQHMGQNTCRLLSHAVFTSASFISMLSLLLSCHSLLSRRPSVHCPSSAPTPIRTELLSPS